MTMRSFVLPLLLGGLTACGSLIGIDDNLDTSRVDGGAPGAGASGAAGAGAGGVNPGGAAGQGGAGNEPGGAGQAGQAGNEPGGAGQGGAGQGGLAGQAGAGESGMSGTSGQGGAGQGGAGQAGQAGMSGGSGQGGAGPCAALHVSPSGDDGASGCDKAAPVKTIATALAKVVPGQTAEVLVCEGQYAQAATLVVDRAIALRGGYDCTSWASGQLLTAIVPDLKANPPPAQLVQLSAQVTLENLTIDAQNAGPHAALLITSPGSAPVTVSRTTVRAGGGHYGVEVHRLPGASATVTLDSNLIVGGTGAKGCHTGEQASVGVLITGDSETAASSPVTLTGNKIFAGDWKGSTGQCSVERVAGVQVQPAAGPSLVNLTNNVIDGGSGGAAELAGVHAAFGGDISLRNNRIHGGRPGLASSEVAGVVIDGSASASPRATLVTNMIHGGSGAGTAGRTATGVALRSGQNTLAFSTIYSGTVASQAGNQAVTVEVGASVTSLILERNDLLTADAQAATSLALSLDVCPKTVVQSASVNVLTAADDLLRVSASGAACLGSYTAPVEKTPAMAALLSQGSCDYTPGMPPGQSCTAADLTQLLPGSQCQTPGPQCAPLDSCGGGGTTACLQGIFGNWGSDGRQALVGDVATVTAAQDIATFGWKLRTTLPCPLLTSGFPTGLTKVAVPSTDIFGAPRSPNQPSPGAQEGQHPGNCQGPGGMGGMNGGGGGGQPNN